VLLPVLQLGGQLRATGGQAFSSSSSS